jgi:hypothetical protein
MKLIVEVDDKVVRQPALDSFQTYPKFGRRYNHGKQSTFEVNKMKTVQICPNRILKDTLIGLKGLSGCQY